MPSSVVGLGLLVVIAIPFALIGTILAYTTGSTIVSAKAMQAWPTVPAKLESLELKSEGSSSSRAVAAYSYSIKGQT